MFNSKSLVKGLFCKTFIVLNILNSLGWLCSIKIWFVGFTLIEPHFLCQGTKKYSAGLKIQEYFSKNKQERKLERLNATERSQQVLKQSTESSAFAILIVTESVNILTGSWFFNGVCSTTTLFFCELQMYFT